MNTTKESSETATPQPRMLSTIYASPPVFLSIVSHFGKHFIAGTVAGVCEGIVGHPLDTIKARLQADAFHSRGVTSPIQCAQLIVKEEGPLALYRGISSAILRSSIGCSVLFGVMSGFKNLFQVDQQESIFSSRFIAAALCTGIVEGIVYCPLEVVKVQMQTTIVHGAEPSPSQVCRSIFLTHGFKSFFRGSFAFCQRDMIGNVAYFGTYELVKQQLTNLKSQNQILKHRTEHDEVSTIAISGACAGVAFYLVGFPFDTVKSVMQADCFHTPKYKNSLYCAMELAKQGGFKRFYRGITPSLIRAAPCNAIIFVVFENVVTQLDRLF